MLKKKKQQIYINKRCENILLCVNNFSAHKSQEELHKLRVEMKKLKAYAAFTSKLTGKNFKKSLEAVTEIFRKAGEIRTAHLNLQALKKYGVRSSSFKREQQAVSENVTEQFLASSQRYIENIKSACSAIRDKCHDINNKDIAKLYSKEIESLSLFFRENFSEDKLHSRRKTVKMLVYVENLLPENLKQELALNFSYFDTLQEAAGKWHDAVVLIERLKDAQTNKEKTERLVQQKDGLLQAVKLLVTHFEKNLSLKKTMYVGP